MKKVVLIPCVSKKQDKKCFAKDMYTSPLFKLNLEYANKISPSEILILSAKYGLLELNNEIEPYNETLNTKSNNEIREWSKEILNKLKQKFDIDTTEFIFLTGDKYRKFIISELKHYGIPMKGLTIGKQLKFLKDRINEQNM